MKWLFIALFPLFVFAADTPPQSPPPPASTETPATEEIVPESEEVAPALSSDMYQKQFYRTLILTLIIVVGALVLIWFVRKFSKDRPFQANHKKNIKILERRQISPSTYLYHIQIGSKQIVISESKNEIRVVANLDWDDSEATI